MTHSRQSIIEALEPRALFSATLPAFAPATASAATSTVATAVPTVAGPELHLTEGVKFSGKVGFYASPVLDPPDKYAATINWGDGAVSQATLTLGQSGSSFGYIISGAHTYTKGGIYTAKITLVTTPINPKSGLATNLVEYIVDHVIVDSKNGFLITELVGNKFTAEVGKFSFPAPATNLTATINWGDGSTSTGTITSTGVSGIDVINFKITGSHTYKKVGLYAIHIVVHKPNLMGGVFVVTTIDSAAKVIEIAPTA